MNTIPLRPPLILKILLANPYLSHVLITRRGHRSLTLEPPSPSTRVEGYNERLEDSFDEDSDESDDEINNDIDNDIGNDIQWSDMPSMPHGRSTKILSGGSTDYQSNNNSTAYTSEDPPSYIDAQETSSLPPDSLFSIQPTDSLFPDASDSFLWNDDTLLTHQTEQWNPETAGNSALTTAVSARQENIATESQKEQDLKQRRRDSAGTRLILENVQPDTVGTIVKMLFDSGTDIKMRLESTETEKE